jgi:lipopolysaccharide exporter
MQKKYAYWLNSGKYSMLQKLMVILFGVIGFMMLARKVEPPVLGVWGLFLIISSIVETSRNALIRNGYILFINTKKEREHSNIEYAAIAANIIFTTLFILFFVLLGSIVEGLLNAPGLSLLLYYYAFTLLLLLPFSYLEIFFSARTDFRAIFWIYFARNGIQLIGIAFYFFGDQVITLNFLAIIYCFAVSMGLLIGWLHYRRYPAVKVTKNRKTVVEFVHYGKYVFGNNVFSLIFRSLDTMLTSTLISPSASALYSTSTRITNFVDLPSQVLGDIMFPKAAQSMRDGNRSSMKNIYEKSVAATLTFTVPVIAVIFIFPKHILLLLAGESYVHASGILQVMVFYGLFLPFIKQFGNIMDAMGRPDINFKLMAGLTVLNIVLTYLGLHFFGLNGAAYGTLSSYFILFLITQFMLDRKLGISLFQVLKNMFMFYPDYLQIAGNYFKNARGNVLKKGL